MTDLFDLNRFVDAQARDYETALGETRGGRKRTHWMWFVFPQFAGLGRSVMARHYAIASVGEAQAYLAHPLLSFRYRECVSSLEDLTGTGAESVFGTIDAMKLHSSLTLFAEISDMPICDALIGRWFGSERDLMTIRLMEASRARRPPGSPFACASD